MHRLILAPALALIAAPAAAQPDGPERPVTHREVDAVDVATTPMNDLNLRKDEIPQLLIDAQVRPYDLTGLDRCSQLAARIGELDAILGDDLDLPQAAGQRVSPGRVAQYVVGSFIPFRGVIREVSGANDQRRRLQAAIEAGLARRGFLKGIGQQRGCRYPARSATREVWDQYVAANRQPAKTDKPEAAKVADASQK
jgi:hypothetical protein